MGSVEFKGPESCGSGSWHGDAVTHANQVKRRKTFVPAVPLELPAYVAFRVSQGAPEEEAVAEWHGGHALQRR